LNRLAAPPRTILYATVAVLSASGMAWTFIHSLALKALLMKVHGGSAMIMLIVLGMLLPTHVPADWRSRSNRKTGPMMLAISALLTLTGYLLYYAGNEAVRDGASHVHTVIGFALPILLGLHAVRPMRAAGFR
jgi:hypothetical protein